jgi:hypothetical protein
MCDAFSFHNVEKQAQVSQVEAHRSILEHGVSRSLRFDRRQTLGISTLSGARTLLKLQE